MTETVKEKLGLLQSSLSKSHVKFGPLMSSRITSHKAVHPTIPQRHFQLCSSALGSAEVGVPINCLATRAGCASDWRGWDFHGFQDSTTKCLLCHVLGQYWWAKHVSCLVLVVCLSSYVLSKIHYAVSSSVSQSCHGNNPFHDITHS